MVRKWSFEAELGGFYSYGHLLDVSGYKWDYTFYNWGYKYL
jgi:hypothetical protein